MSTQLGPQLIGETEKTLSALLRRFLEGTGLREAQWVTLRMAELLDDDVDEPGLAAAVSARAQFRDAPALVGELTERDLLEDGRLTPAGRDLLMTVQTTITCATSPIWDDLLGDDVAAATRVLNEIMTRARAVLG